MEHDRPTRKQLRTIAKIENMPLTSKFGGKTKEAAQAYIERWADKLEEYESADFGSGEVE